MLIGCLIIDSSGLRAPETYSVTGSHVLDNNHIQMIVSQYIGDIFVFST